MKFFLGQLGAGAVSEEIQTVAGALREKGLGRFSRAFLAAGALVLLAYLGVYAPSRRRRAHLEDAIRDAKIMSAYGQRYKDLSSRLAIAYARLPAPTEREQWLSNAVRDSLNAQGLIMEDFKPIHEQEQGGLIFQSSSISLRLTFAQFYAWIRRLESSAPLMHVQTAELNKLAHSMGSNSAACQIVTIIPKQSFR